MESNKVLHKQYNNTINQLFNVLSTPIDVRKTINISMYIGAWYIYVFIMHVFLYEEKWVVDENVYTNTVSTNFLPEIFS